jgi:hypothetical protein
MVSSSMSYDLIGDIHGQAGKLVALLRELGYVERGGVWVPPAGRMAIFVGDLIDRGPEQLKVLAIVRAMVDAGHALAIMGNHEFNAIGFAMPDPRAPGQFLRRRSPKNVAQHAEFLRQVGEGSDLHQEWVEWFRWLPPALDLGGLRVVHAWWHEAHVDRVAEHWAPGSRMSDEFLVAAFERGSPLYEAMEGLSKGLEIDLPDGHSFVDHGGVERFKARAKWWHEAPRSLRDVAIVGADQEHRLPDAPLPSGFPEPVAGAPVFVGHYWMEGRPAPMSAKVACLDWSAAKDGPLVAYRWDGESVIDAAKFVAVGGRSAPEVAVEEYCMA